MKKISDFATEAEEALHTLKLAEREPSTLYAPIEYALTAGGKRLRPALMLMTAESFGGAEALTKALRPASGIEAFHNFTLLHDDVMDNSDMRRGRPTVHKKWDENTAILSGDTMLTLATELIADVADDKLREVLGVFNRMAIEVYEGQRLDLDFEDEESIDTDTYVEMIRLKTGALLGASAKIGAIIGGAGKKDADAMEKFGNMLGIAFQIQDDWLDTFGDSTTFGKPIGGDILNDKKTFLLVSALNRRDGDTEALRSAMKLTGDTKIKAVTRIYEKMGLQDESRKSVASYSSKAIGAIKSTSMADDKKEIFLKLVEKLTGRKR